MRVAASMLAMLIVELPMPKAYAQTTSQSGQQQPSDSQAALSARIDAAYGLMMDAGRFDEGYAQLRAALLDGTQGLVAVARKTRRVPLVLENARHEFADVVLVVDDKDVSSHSFNSLVTSLSGRSRRRHNR